MYSAESAKRRVPETEAEAQLSAETRALALLNEASSRLWRVRGLEEGLHVALSSTIEMLGAAKGNIQLLGSDNVLRIAMQAGFGPEFLDRFHEVPASGASSCARAMRAKSRVVVSDTETDVDYEPLRAIARRSGYRSVQSTPLVSRDGSLIGILSTHFAHPHSLTSSEEKRLDLYARQTSDFIERCRIDEELRRSEADRKRLDEVRAHLAAIVESSNDAIISKGLDTIILSWNQGAERLFGYTAEEAIGRPITLLIPEERLDEEPKILERIRAGERVDHFETVRQRKDGRLVDISLTISPVRNAAGEIIAASKIARDVSERKQLEAHQAVLMAELNHRVKNTLATVISIARQSFAGDEKKAARETFDARIRALALTHGRLAESSWSSVPLGTLFGDELEPFREISSANIRLNGPEVALAPKCALTLGLAIHELVTNAAKYGALSKAGGAIEICWALADDRLRIEWCEKDGPPVTPPTRSGFGRTLLERVIANDLQCKVGLDFRPEGLRCLFSIPARPCVAVPQ